MKVKYDLGYRHSLVMEAKLITETTRIGNPVMLIAELVLRDVPYLSRLWRMRRSLWHSLDTSRSMFEAISRVSVKVISVYWLAHSKFLNDYCGEHISNIAKRSLYTVKLTLHRRT